VGTWIVAILLLGAAGAAAILWISFSGRRGGAPAPRPRETEPADEDELDQRLLSIESKIRDLDLLRAALVGSAGEFDVRGVVEKQDAILSYLRGYHDKYQGLLLARMAAERLRELASAELGVEAEILGIAELKKAVQQRYVYMRERSPGGIHEELDRRKEEADRRIDSALREIVIVATNRIIASESPLSRDRRPGPDRAEALVAEGGESEASLNREYDRFLSEIELS
jgi:hypothetical protein